MDAIEILSPALLETMPETLEEMQALVAELRVPRGWHYYMDFCWVARVLETAPSMKILDAGAGNGAIQWWLASRGADVLSVDIETRNDPGRHFDDWCTHRKRGKPNHGKLSWRSFMPPKQILSASEWKTKTHRTWGRLWAAKPRYSGSVEFWDCDLTDLSQLESESMDAIVSISALEHNSPEGLSRVVAELERVLKPGGQMAITVGGARDEDWFHEPSKGWCFTEKSLAEIFGLDAYDSNFSHYDEILADLIACDILKNDIPDFYFEAGDNGMPWGRWDPTYHSVGIFKTKPEAGTSLRSARAEPSTPSHQRG